VDLGAVLLIRFSIQALLDHRMDQHLLVVFVEQGHEVTEVGKHVGSDLVCVTHEVVSHFKHERLQLLTVSLVLLQLQHLAHF
jgi:hypothetical protein